MRIWQLAARTLWAITEDHLRVILDIANRQNPTPEAVAAELGRPLENTYEVEYREGVAILPVEGPLFRYANLFTQISGATSYERLAQDFNAALADDQVRAILLNINSPGGEADGNAEFAEMIHAARGVKPIVAYVGGMGASAAYWIASAADEVIAHETALLGSIGVRTALIDDSERMAMEGLREYVIVSSQSPYKATDPADAGDRGRIQQVVDDLATVFVATVARNRGVSEETVLSDFGQGDVLVGQKAVAAGLADRLGSFEGALAELIERTSSLTPPGGSGYQPAISGRSNKEGHGMWLTAKAPEKGDQIEASAENLRKGFPEATAEIEQAAVAPIQAKADEASASADKARGEGEHAERERITAILDCEEAKGREATARQLALTAGMTAENAKRILAATPQAKGETGFFSQMVDPDVGPDAPDGENDIASAVQQSAALGKAFGIE
jgi:signal peptide peptidase SppA